jgi:hypothetical protein
VGGGGGRERGRRMNMVQIMYTYVCKIPVETVLGIRGEGMKESSGGGEFKYNMLNTF